MRRRIYLIAVALFAVCRAQPVTKEYVRLGDRVIAIESTAAAPPAVTGATVTPLAVNAARVSITVNEPAGAASISVVNLLINSYLSGAWACYLALVPNQSVAYLVTDSGTDLLPAVAIGQPGSAANSQCTFTGTGVTVSSTGTSMTLSVDLTFTPHANFNSNPKIVYGAVRSVRNGVELSSGWRSVGVAQVGTPSSSVAQASLVPSQRVVTAGQSTQANFTFTFPAAPSPLNWNPPPTDDKIANVLANLDLDGRNACYLAFVVLPSGNPLLYLVNDVGDGLLPAMEVMTPPNPATRSNSQCTVTQPAYSVTPDAKTLNFGLSMQFSPAFRGFHVFYTALRHDAAGYNSGWLAAGSMQVQ